MILSRLLFIVSFIALSQIAIGQCFPDRHNTSKDEAWLSCTPSQNPNAIRGVSHWIMYDLGDIQELGKSVFWNYNTPGEQANGIHEFAIDYSYNGINWQSYGNHTLEESGASSFYEGITGPDFSNIAARYILITALSNHGGDCFGFAEIKVEVGDLVSGITTDQISGLKLNVSPNPAKDVLRVSFESISKLNCKLLVANSLGQAVLSKDLQVQAGKSLEEINISTFPPGIYLVSIQNRTQISSREIIITK